MNPVMIIPTYVGAKRKKASYDVIATYDHATPIAHQGELPRCLASLRDNEIDIPIVLLVVAEEGVEREASAKIREIAFAFRETLDIRVIDSAMLEQFYQRTEELGLGDIWEGIGLVGYGAIRNLGLVVAATLGYTELICIDDDEVVTSKDFLEQALYGLGKLSKKGVPVLVKSGFFVDRRGQWKSRQSNAWYNRFWEQGTLFNKWIIDAMAAPRLSHSNVLNGGVMAIHREAFRRVAFDPWIPRGEDLDYLLNLKMYGGGVWFDNKWSILHLPPTERNEAQRFKQDIYRWIYEHRKLEYAKSQIDLLQIQPHTLDPYPGPFLETSISKRVFITALLRTLGRPRDRQGYFKAARAARREAPSYAETFCSRYYEFQLGWAQVLATIETDPQIRILFGELSRVVSNEPIDYESIMIEVSNSYYDQLNQLNQSVALEHLVSLDYPGKQEHLEQLGQAVRPAQPKRIDETPDSASTETESFLATRDGVKPDLFDFELDLAALGINPSHD